MIVGGEEMIVGSRQFKLREMDPIGGEHKGVFARFSAWMQRKIQDPKFLQEKKVKLFEGIYGNVLEIGVG